MELIGYFASILIGISLGLIGGGGSVLTVPVLVYLFGVNPVIATSYSLFVVGLTSAFGSVQYFRRGLVKTRTVLTFGLPAVASGIIVRKFLIPAIPETIATVGHLTITNSMVLMLWFSLLMIAASFSMISKKLTAKSNHYEIRAINYQTVFLEGLIVGAITGTVGVGGGFLIIPALVIVSKFPIREAVGTSLAIIALNSLLVFSGTGHHEHTDWILLLSIAALAIIGTVIGFKISEKVDGNKLKPAFGYFVLAMGFYIIFMELYKH